MIEVTIEELHPMRVVSALGFGASPEPQAWEMIFAFAQQRGIDPGRQRFFGFNNPNPSPGSPNYGYEQWMTVGPEVEAEAPYEIKQVPPGRYAVTRFTGLEHIGDRWQALVGWCEEHGHRISCEYGRCLEEHLNPGEADAGKWTFVLRLGLED